MAHVTQQFNDLLVHDAVQVDDPIEQHIIREVIKLTQLNKRLKLHIEKTGRWVSLKPVVSWKPFDFYQYFCSKYAERYGSEYHPTGNLIATYKQIDEFRQQHTINKEAYKKFIDTAFTQYFTNVNIPRVGHVCNIRLYNHLMNETHTLRTAHDFRELDTHLTRDLARFEDHVSNWELH